LDYEILYSFVVATIALAFAPGPDNIYVLMQSIVNGSKYGLVTTLGLVSGCLIHTTLLAFGVSAIIKNNPTLYFGLKIFGAVYLIYLAFKVFKSSGEIKLNKSGVNKVSLIAVYKQGFLMNVLNPKVALFFLAFFPGFLFSNTLSTVVQFYILGFIFIITAFLAFTLITFLSASLAKFLKESKGFGIVLKWMQIVVFLGIAVYLLFSNN
jgi:threonine/homoserine/homoserine lactone efflux protein